MLRSCPQPPKQVTQLFDCCVRLTETDEGGANPVAEAMIFKDRSLQDKKRLWGHAYIICLAHKTHACTTKLFSLQENLISIIIHSCKTLFGAGAFSTLREVATELLLQRFARVSVKDTCLDDGALAFRAQLMTYFLPATSTPKKHATVAAALSFFNGDLRKEQITHVCNNCCENEVVSRKKASTLFRHLLQAVRPAMFARNNWVAWAESLVFFGVADGFHHLIVDAWQTAFSGKNTIDPQETTMAEASVDYLHMSTQSADNTGTARSAEEDAQQRAREEHARSLKMSLTGMRRGLWQQVLLLRVPLEPVRGLMHFLTHSISQQWEEEQMKNMWLLGIREFRGLLLHNGEVLPTFFEKTLSQFQDASLWQEFGQTEEFRSRIFRYTFRPGAVAYQLVQKRVEGLPFSLLTLLGSGPDLAREAARLLSIPACMRDSFSAMFLNKFSSVELLLGPTAKHILFIFARRCKCSTYSTERLHSKNLRRAKSRAETHRMSVKDLPPSTYGLVWGIFCSF